jgi:hypothetical protein
LVARVGNLGRHATPHYDRCSRLYNSLTAADIRACRDAAALDTAYVLFDKARHSDVPAYGLGRVWTREALGQMMVEVHNQRVRVSLGRLDRPRPKGPRFDPERLPLTALDRLIQRHPDVDLVDQLRAERERRFKFKNEVFPNDRPSSLSRLQRSLPR